MTDGHHENREGERVKSIFFHQRCGTSLAAQKRPDCDRLEFAQSYGPQTGIRTINTRRYDRRSADLWEFYSCNPETVKNTIKPLVTQEEAKICWISACASGGYDSVLMKRFMITQSIRFLWNTPVLLSRWTLEVLQRGGMETWWIMTQHSEAIPDWQTSHLLFHKFACVCIGLHELVYQGCVFIDVSR